MGLKPGQTNNGKGRPKGSSNKITKTTREFMNDFIQKNRSKLQRDWNKLEPYQRVQMFEKLVAFTIPKMSSLELERLPNEQLDLIIDKILNNGK